MSKELPPKLVDTAIGAQQLAHNRVLGPPYRAVRWLVAGSSYPNFNFVEWQTVATVEGHEGATRFRAIAGDPDAGRLPRFWKKVAVVGVEVEDLEQVRQQEGEGQEVVGYHGGEQTRVGVVGGGFHHIRIGEDTLALAALRQGTGGMEATMGLWYRDAARLVVPQTFQVVDKLVSLPDLRQDYHVVPLV